MSLVKFLLSKLTKIKHTTRKQGFHLPVEDPRHVAITFLKNSGSMTISNFTEHSVII